MSSHDPATRATRRAARNVDLDENAEVAARADRTLIARIASHTSWANTTDRAARTEPARRGLLDKFARQVDPDGVLAPAERERRAEAARKAFYLSMSRKSAEARRKRAAERMAGRPCSAAAAAELRAQREQGGQSA